MADEDDITKALKREFLRILDHCDIQYMESSLDEFIEADDYSETKLLSCAGYIPIAYKKDDDKISFIRYQKGFFITDESKQPFIKDELVVQRINSLLCDIRAMILTLKRYFETFMVIKYRIRNYNIHNNTYTMTIYIAVSSDFEISQKFNEMDINNN